MVKATAWDVYLKTQELSCNALGCTTVSINVIAGELAIGADLAEQYAISLQMLDILLFDAERKEIIVPLGFFGMNS